MYTYKFYKRLGKVTKNRCHLCGTILELDCVDNNSRYSKRYIRKFGVSVDHIIPAIVGGKRNRENLRLAHKFCNSKRNCIPIEYYRMLRCLELSLDNFIRFNYNFNSKI